MNFKTGLLFITLAALGCNNADNNNEHNSRAKAATTPKPPADSLYEEVNNLHDEGMAKTGKLRTALVQLQKKLDSLVKLPAGKIDEEYQQSLIDLQEDLNYADHAMFTWMTEFKDTIKNDTELRIKYLQSEKEKVTKVRDNILNGLQRADSLLKK
jgi:hypothetical protein